MHYYFIAPTSIIRSNCDTLTYHSDKKIDIGTFVTVPVGKKTALGVVIKTSKKPSFETRAIDTVHDIQPLPRQLIETSQWMAHYYATPLATVLQTVLPSGITKKRRATVTTPNTSLDSLSPVTLTEHQQQAVEAIDTSPHNTTLLHGITGSGKTHIYLHYAQKNAARGLSTIILVPEIALTSQLVSMAKQYCNVIVAHSRQTESERHATWNAIAHCDHPLTIIGPRSALFLPVQKIGSIIIDECHEPSYKQDKSPRYSALRVAKILANQHDARLMLGSATPLMSDYHLAHQLDGAIVELTQLAKKQAVPPTITVVDNKKREHFTQHQFFSDQLITSMDDALSQSRPVLLFHNRRGTANIILCKTCGWQAECTSCHIPLTLHADTHTTICHICNTRHPVPTTCATCNSHDVLFKGIGTKRIQAEIERRYPNKKCVRFDTDTEVKDQLHNVYDDIQSGKIDVIIGTQVVAKGLNIPRLHTVGVVQADAGLSLPDYGAAERTFQLLHQVIGRAGREALDTQVIIQTYQPEHPAVQAGIKKQYASYYEQEMQSRKQALFPPFTYLLKLTNVYKTEKGAIDNAKKVKLLLRKHATNSVQILGPSPSFYERIGDTYRWQIIVKSPDRNDLLALLDHIPKSNWQYELDPISLL